jgi:hypothetical protein
MGLTGEVHLEPILGNVDADIENRTVVLTHTCTNTSREAAGPSAQATVRVWSNGPAWNELCGASRGKAYARRKRSHASRRLPACRREGDPILITTVLITKRTNQHIQGTEVRIEESKMGPGNFKLQR